ERLTFCAHAQYGFDQTTGNHDSRSDQVSPEEEVSRSGSDDVSIEGRSGDAADQGSASIENRDRYGSDLEWENLADGQVSCACRRGCDEEDNAPTHGLRKGSEHAHLKEPSRHGKQNAGCNVGDRNHRLAPHRIDRKST